MSTSEHAALAALAEQEKTSRQEPTAEDRRLTAARALYEDLDSEQAPVLGDLIAFAEERLKVNRGLLAQQKAPENQTEPSALSDDALIFELAKRGLITVSRQ